MKKIDAFVAAVGVWTSVGLHIIQCTEANANFSGNGAGKEMPYSWSKSQLYYKIGSIDEYNDGMKVYGTRGGEVGMTVCIGVCIECGMMDCIQKKGG